MYLHRPLEEPTPPRGALATVLTRLAAPPAIAGEEDCGSAPLRGIVTGVAVGSAVLLLGRESDHPAATVAVGGGVLLGYGAARTTDWRRLYGATG